MADVACTRSNIDGFLNGAAEGLTPVWDKTPALCLLANLRIASLRMVKIFSILPFLVSMFPRSLPVVIELSVELRLVCLCPAYSGVGLHLWIDSLLSVPTEKGFFPAENFRRRKRVNIFCVYTVPLRLFNIEVTYWKCAKMKVGLVILVTWCNIHAHLRHTEPHDTYFIHNKSFLEQVTFPESAPNKLWFVQSFQGWKDILPFNTDALPSYFNVQRVDNRVLTHPAHSKYR